MRTVRFERALEYNDRDASWWLVPTEAGPCNAIIKIAADKSTALQIASAIEDTLEVCISNCLLDGDHVGDDYSDN